MLKNRAVNSSAFSRLPKRLCSGVAALPTLLFGGGIIVSISIALTASLYLYINSVAGAAASLKSLAAAKSGIYDAMIVLARDKSIVTKNYIINVGNETATINICQDCGLGAGKFKISSVGKSFTRQKKMEAIASVDNSTGVIKLLNLTEVPL